MEFKHSVDFAKWVIRKAIIKVYLWTTTTLVHKSGPKMYYPFSNCFPGAPLAESFYIYTAKLAPASRTVPIQYKHFSPLTSRTLSQSCRINTIHTHSPTNTCRKMHYCDMHTLPIRYKNVTAIPLLRCGDVARKEVWQNFVQALDTFFHFFNPLFPGGFSCKIWVAHLLLPPLIIALKER